MSVVTRSIKLETRGNGDVIDITPETRSLVAQSQLGNGTVTVFCPGSTGGLTTIECEPGVVADMARLFDELAPPDRDYAHHRTWGDGNGHSHVRAGLLGPSLVVPFVDGELTLGTWQQIVFLDFDTRARERRLVVQIMGE